jgi:ubiquinone/menaquinone biosynthesis C-methylase UbiE
MAKNDLHIVAAQGFEQAATLYEQARPTYPDEAIDLIKSLCNKPDIIIDLGAGTGKLTRLLGPIGAREIIAIEPVLSMRENLKKIPIITKIIDGTAEHISFEDNTIDIIICAQAFHWFANHRALAELHRVLKPNGLLILIWNLADDSGKEWFENINKYVECFKPDGTPRYKKMEWKNVFDNQKFFSSSQDKQFTHKDRVTRDLFMNRILSISFIAALPAEQKTKLIDQVRNVLENNEEIRDLEEFDECLVTDVYWYSPLKSSSSSFI